MYYFKFIIFCLVFFLLQTPAYATDVSLKLRECEKHLKANRLTSGSSGGTALSCYKEVLEKEPNNAKALAGLETIETRYVGWAKRALKRGQENKVKRYLDSLRLVNPKSPKLAELEAQLQPPANASTSTVAPSVTSVPISNEATTQTQPSEEATSQAQPHEEVPLPRKAQIVDAGQIYELINTTDCLVWPSLDMKEKGGKNGWRSSFYPKKGETGTIVGEMKHCHFDDNVLILKMDEYYVPISSVGVQIISEGSEESEKSEKSATN